MQKQMTGKYPGHLLFHKLRRSGLPPLCKGRWAKSEILAGGVVKNDNPPGKNHRFLPAPLCKGGLEAP